MAILRSETTTHKILLNDGEEFNLYILSNYDFGSTYSIIKIESATGDGGVTYNNGRLVENIPMSGVLMAESLADLNTKVVRLRKIADRKEVVEFVYPYKSDIRTNLFYIEEVRFQPEAGKDTEIPFSMTLTEKRDANVKTTQVNLVNYAQSESLKSIYEQTLVGTN